MGVIKVKNPRWFRLLKFLSYIFPFEFVDGQSRGRFEGAAEFFTQEQAWEIAVRVGYKQGYLQIHKAMWRAGLNKWQVIADLLNENGQGLLALTEIKNIGKATAIGIFYYGLTENLIWFEN